MKIDFCSKRTHKLDFEFKNLISEFNIRKSIELFFFKYFTTYKKVTS